MTNVASIKTWYSGNWKSSNRKKPPYNGIKIQGTPTYDQDNKFLSAKVSFFDYTYDPDGLQSDIDELTPEQGWTAIPMPPYSPPSPSDPPNQESFTINGHVELVSQPSGMYLRIRLHFGIMAHEELGFIMKFDQTKKTP